MTLLGIGLEWNAVTGWECSISSVNTITGVNEIKNVDAGQLAIIIPAKSSPGIVAAETGLLASQFALGQEVKQAPT